MNNLMAAAAASASSPFLQQSPAYLYHTLYNALAATHSPMAGMISPMAQYIAALSAANSPIGRSYSEPWLSVNLLQLQQLAAASSPSSSISDGSNSNSPSGSPIFGSFGLKNFGDALKAPVSSFLPFWMLNSVDKK